MDDFQKEYNIPDLFYHRYFIRNAENRFVNDLKRFMLWREGHFLNPQNKIKYVREFLAKEVEDYFEHKRFVLPQIGFSLTTRCTLHCRDCIALQPLFELRRDGGQWEDYTYDADSFARELQMITDGCDGVKRLFLHGGEPLLNKDLPAIVEFSAANDKIELVELISNGTIVPNEALLDVMERYRHKVYMAINNYGKNQELKKRLHHDVTIPLLDARGIKHPLYSDLHWYRQKPLENQGYTPEEVKAMFAECWCKHSIQILKGIMSICPRASIGLLLGIIDTPPEDIVDLRNAPPADMRKALDDYYRKDTYVACGFCAPQNEVIDPAIQM